MNMDQMSNHGYMYCMVIDHGILQVLWTCDGPETGRPGRRRYTRRTA